MTSSTEKKDGAIIATGFSSTGSGVAVSVGEHGYAEINYVELPGAAARLPGEEKRYVLLRFAFEDAPRYMTPEAAKGLGEALIRVADGPPEEVPF